MFGDISVKKELLRLLDEDREVRRKLRGLLSGAEENDKDLTPKNKAVYPPFECKNYAVEMERLKAAIAEERGQKEVALRESDGLRRQLEIQQNDFARQKQELTDECEELRRAQTEAAENCRRLERECAEKDASLKDGAAENNRLRSEKERTERELSKAQTKLAEKDGELRQRFSRGWNIWRQYQQLTNGTKESLQRVFAHADDFTSFICCGAQSDAPEVIWDIMSDCWDKKLLGDLAILREIFAYSLELVNSTKTKPLFEILSVKTGDKYDRKYHLVEPFCEVQQGNVEKVCVQGFRNVFVNKVIRQSLVSLE